MITETNLCRLLQGDSLQQMRRIKSRFVHSIVTDPPYGLSFMGKGWDHGVPGVPYWQEALRVTRPGGYMLAFGGTRTWHRLAANIEDAGWEIRDTIMWCYGTGFPKSMDVSKAIDERAFRDWLDRRPKLKAKLNAMRGKAKQAMRERLLERAGLSRPVTGLKLGADRLISQTDDGYRDNEGRWGDESGRDPYLHEAATEEGKRWQGYGTALKPAWEPIILAQRPSKDTIAHLAQVWGTGGLNIDGCRVGTETRTFKGMSQKKPEGAGTFRDDNWQPKDVTTTVTGRWPANLILDEEARRVFDAQAPESKSSDRHFIRGKRNADNIYDGLPNSEGTVGCGYGDSGKVSRFFYCPKATRADRDFGLNDDSTAAMRSDGRKSDVDNPYQRAKVLRNHHPTVKPHDLMRYLVRLVTPHNGIVLDPFMGSGSTGRAAIAEGKRFIGIDRERDYIEISKARIGAQIRESMSKGRARRRPVRS